MATKKFKVTIYYQTSYTMFVNAENEDEAINKAREIDNIQQLIEGLHEDDDCGPEICEINPIEHEYYNDLIVENGNLFMAFTSSDEDCEDIESKEFYSLKSAQQWLDQVNGREVHDE